MSTPVSPYTLPARSGGGARPPASHGGDRRVPDRSKEWWATLDGIREVVRISGI